MLLNQEDNMAPPGFAVVVHHRPHHFFAKLVCRSVRAELNRLQLLAHAYQPARNQQANACWQSLSHFTSIQKAKHAHMFAQHVLNMISSSQCIHDSACGVPHRALVDASCDHTVNQHMLALPTLFCMLLAQPDLGMACLHSVKRLAMSVAVAVMHIPTHSVIMQALQCMQQKITIRLLQITSHT